MRAARADAISIVVSTAAVALIRALLDHALLSAAGPPAQAPIRGQVPGVAALLWGPGPLGLITFGARIPQLPSGAWAAALLHSVRPHDAATSRTPSRQRFRPTLSGCDICVKTGPVPSARGHKWLSSSARVP